MPAFEYTAVDAGGRERKGVVEGDTARSVRQTLRDQGLLPMAVGEVSKQETARSKSGFSIRRGVSASDLALLTRQLATLVHSGLPLDESLLAVSEQTENPRIRGILMGVRGKVLEGHSLADGLGEFPNAFPEMYRATVAAGEQSGHLDTVLERLADYTEAREQLRSRTLAAMLYPVVLFVLCSGIIVLMMTYVVPRIVKQFENSKHALPLLTQGLIWFSSFVRNWGIWILFGAILGFFLFKRWLRNPAAQRRFHSWQLKVPLLGKIIRGTNTTRFARTFSTLTASAVPVLEAMRIAGEVISNLPMRDAVDLAAARVREGAPIAKSLGATRMFPPMMIHLIGSGESSGELEAMLDRAATNQEREMDSLLGTLVALLGPLMIVMMGAIVLVIVIAMLMPIIQLNDLVGR
jgi:general secretion pathway protein F